MKTIICYISLLFLSIQAVGQVSDPEGIFEEGNQLFEEGKLDEALQEYLLLIENGHVSADLFYNTANTYYKLDSLGKSIVYLEMAKRLSPGNEDIKNNLEIAYAKTSDNLEYPNSGIENWIQETFFNVPPNLWSWMLFVSLFLLFLSLFFALRVRKTSFKNYLYTLTVVSFLGALFFTYLSVKHYYFIKDDSEAIVISRNVEVMTAPADNSELAFELHEGAKVIITKRSDAWSEITIPGNYVGWIKNSDIAVIKL